MIEHLRLSKTELREMISSGMVKLAGNKKLRIYGTLDCRSGKKMAARNRVFFADVEEAIQNGFRPCGHCMKTEYLKWKSVNS